MSFRKAFPYIATLIVVIGLVGAFALRPTPFIGLTPEAVAASLDDQLGRGTSGCEEVADKHWRCTVAEGDFDLEINAFGCWTANPVEKQPELGTPSTISGCVTLLDH